MKRLTFTGTAVGTLLLLFSTILFNFSSPAEAAGKKQLQKKTAKPGRIIILGKYNDISSVKRTFKTGKDSAAPRTAASTNPKRSPEKAIDPGRIGKQISARSAIIIDARSGETLFAKAPDNPRQPASTIKILTGMIALQSLSGSEQVAVSRWAADQPRSKVDLNPKKQYRANDLINAVLLASANDASVALAEKIAGSESSFARMMTEKARQWGARNTVCKTATGLTAKGQTSTARDLAVMFRHVMQNPAFASRMKQVKVKTSYGSLLRNHNKALWQVEGTQGGKTGFTNAARQTYVGKFKRGEQEIVVAVMGCETMWADVKKLVQHGFTLNSRQETTARPPRIEVREIVAQSQP
ncbi:MAG: D-alanyl-D-alanine carboxypeptidase [Desulfobulbaceae bacterium]|nr:MAG: D-alanyl-D-alanine carboxypeptidase [Desulfobulbaceae bacterium]